MNAPEPPLDPDWGCETDGHEWTVVAESDGYTTWKCTRCGMETTV